MNDYAGISKLRQPQRIKNMTMSEAMLVIDIKPKFNDWFNKNIEFGFGMGWVKGIAKKFCWYGYLAGYKQGVLK